MRELGSVIVTSNPLRCAKSQVLRSPSGCTNQNLSWSNLNKMPFINRPTSQVHAITYRPCLSLISDIFWEKYALEMQTYLAQLFRPAARTHHKEPHASGGPSMSQQDHRHCNLQNTFPWLVLKQCLYLHNRHETVRVHYCRYRHLE